MKEDAPAGVLAVRVGPGGTCSAAGSAIDALFYGSLAASTLLVALRFAAARGGSPAPPDPPDDPPEWEREPLSGPRDTGSA